MRFVKRRIAFEDDRCVPEVEASQWSQSLHCYEVRWPCRDFGGEGLLTSRTQDVPQQGNGWDCGVYVCAFMEAFAHGKTPVASSGFTFDNRRAASYRTRMLEVLGPARTIGILSEPCVLLSSTRYSS